MVFYIWLVICIVVKGIREFIFVDFYVFILSEGKYRGREVLVGEGMSWYCFSFSLVLDVFFVNDVK